MMALLMSLHALAIDAMLPALDEMAAEFGVLEENRRQLVIGMFLLATGAGSLLPGVLADRFGRKPVLMVGLVAFVVFSLACAIAPDFDTLLWMRVIQGVLSAGLMVMPAAIIRDQYEGDAMARLFSLVSAVFITVPVIAPALGQLVMEIANWHMIFILLAVMGTIAGLWAWFRLPETLHKDFRQEIRPRALARNMYTASTSRVAVGYILGTALVLGPVFGYVSSAQQLIGDYFGAGEMFPYVFGGTAATMALASVVNSRIVERFGARRVSHIGLLIFIAVSLLQVFVSHSSHREDLTWFLPLMACNLALLGFLGSNFGSIAMQPFAEIAGAASSIQSFVRMVLASLIGIAIGQFYDGTARPLAYSLLIAGVAALMLVLFSEKGRLFRRLHPRGSSPATHHGGLH